MQHLSDVRLKDAGLVQLENNERNGKMHLRPLLATGNTGKQLTKFRAAKQ